MVQITKMLTAFGAALILAACGGGGNAAGPASTGFAQTYTASAAAGELLNYSIDTTALTYSYTITKSSYGCEVISAPCHTGSGTLTKNSDGTFSPSQSPNSRIFALQNGLLAGSVKLTLNGVAQTIPIIGVANPIATTASLAGTYNFMSLQCTGKTYGAFSGCDTYSGTVTVASDGTYRTCTGANLSATDPICSYATSGNVTHLGGGIWQFQVTSIDYRIAPGIWQSMMVNPPNRSTTNYLLAFTAPNGQNVGVIDFNDSSTYGFGQAIISSQIATNSAGLSGNYVWSNDYGQSGLVTLNPNSTTNTGLAITQNSPWNGIATVTGGSYGTGYGMIAGNGVYVYRNPTVSAAYFEVGLKVQ